MHSLESHVDQIIASLAASPARKREIRSELLLHLQSAYEEELRRHSDPDQALSAALSRLGNPEQLRRELQLGLPVTDLLFCALRRPLLVILLQMIVLFPLLLIAVLDGEMGIAVSPSIAVILPLLQPFLAGQIVIAFNLFLIGLLHDWFRSRSQNPSRTFRLIRSVSTFLILLASGTLYVLLSGASMFSLGYAIRWTALSLAVTLLLPLSLSLYNREFRERTRGSSFPPLLSD